LDWLRTVLAQQIAAFSLPPGSVCVAVSGSGRNSATVNAFAVQP